MSTTNRKIPNETSEASDTSIAGLVRDGASGNKISTRGNMDSLNETNAKLVTQFGASKLAEMNNLPDFYTFNKGLIYSHRDFDLFLDRLNKGVKSAIVSGFNPSATIHIGHISVFDTNIFFQKKYKAEVFIPLSDDESYVAGKIETQEEGVKNALKLSRSLIAFGFDTSKTNIIIDHIYTDIYNLAIKFSKGITLSSIKAVYGYSPDQNIGLHFYPAVQAAHVAFPQTRGMPNVLVPIGPDEDAHIRVGRDVANKYGFNKAAVLHSQFLPGLDGLKMSKSKGNAVFFLDGEREIKRKIMSAYSGGRDTLEEHRRLGGNPDTDVSYLYLKYFFLTKDEAEDLAQRYKSGKLLSGEMKSLFAEHLTNRILKFQDNYKKVTEKDIEKTVLCNPGVDVRAIIDKSGIMS